MPVDTELNIIENIREFNRFYTREMGILNEGFLDSRFTLPELRILFEVASGSSAMVSQLASTLRMDQGYVSRIVANLKKQDLIESLPDAEDGRKKLLALTRAGASKYTELEAVVRAAVSYQIQRLTIEDRHELVKAMNAITRLLKSGDGSNCLIRPLRLGDIGQIINRHAILYAREQGWDQRFELAVMEVLTNFLQNHNPHNEQGWVAEVEGEFAGCIFAVREDDNTARLRALLVEPKFRSLGLGNQLIEQCIDFCRSRGYSKVVLWTCDALIQARKLYAKHGFNCTRQWPETEFGKDLTSEHWELRL